MRLKKSKNSAEEELVMLINEGYEIVNFMNGDYQDKFDIGSFDFEEDHEIYRNMFVEWRNNASSCLWKAVSRGQDKQNTLYRVINNP